MAKANIKVTLLCPIDRVWQQVTDVANYQWRSDLSSTRIIDDKHFVEVSKNGIETTMTTCQVVKYKLWEFEIDNRYLKGKWTGKFYKQGDNTTLDFTEEVVAKKLYLIPFVGSYIRNQQKLFMRDLKKSLVCEEACLISVLG